jgi:hypothetical protein
MQSSAYARPFAALLLAACGGRIEETTDAGAVGDDRGDASRAASDDASTPPDDDPDTSAPPPDVIDASLPIDSGVPLRYATIYGETLVAGGASLATAEFSTIVGTPAVCTLSTPPNSCAVATCGYAAADPSEKAGAIVVSDGAMAATLTYSAGPPASYDTWQGGSEGWGAPSFLTFAAPASSALPRGLMQSLPFPAGTTLTMPDLMTIGAIDTTAPLVLGWSPPVASEVVLVIETTLPQNQQEYALLACVFDGRTGTVKIPPSNLAELKAMAAGATTVTAGFLTVTRKLDIEQGWAIELAAFGPGGAVAPVVLE